MSSISQPSIHGSRRLLIAASAATGLGNLGFWLLPLTIGVLIDSYGFSESQAGILSTLEVSAIALASLLTATRIPVISLRHTALVFALLAVFGHAASAFAPSFTWLAIARFVAGTGEGAVLATGYAAIAASVNPDRAYAVVFVIVGIGAAVLLALLPTIVDLSGSSSYFLTLAALTALFLPLTAYFPVKSPSMAVEASGQRGEQHTNPHFLPAACMLAAVFLVAFVESCAWTFVEQRGGDVGFDPQVIGYILGGVTIGGVFGGVFAAFLGTRFGRIGPVVLALAVQSLCIAGVYVSDSRLVFTSGLTLWSFCLFFVYPFLLGASATFDRTGRWAAAAGGLLTAGSVIAPGFSGFVVEVFDYTMFAVAILVLSAMSIALFLLSLPRQARHP